MDNVCRYFMWCILLFGVHHAVCETNFKTLCVVKCSRLPDCYSVQTNRTCTFYEKTEPITTTLSMLTVFRAKMGMKPNLGEVVYYNWQKMGRRYNVVKKLDTKVTQCPTKYGTFYLSPWYVFKITKKGNMYVYDVYDLVQNKSTRIAQVTTFPNFIFSHGCVLYVAMLSANGGQIRTINFAGTTNNYLAHGKTFGNIFLDRQEKEFYSVDFKNSDIEMYSSKYNWKGKHVAVSQDDGLDPNCIIGHAASASFIFCTYSEVGHLRYLYRFYFLKYKHLSLRKRKSFLSFQTDAVTASFVTESKIAFVFSNNTMIFYERKTKSRQFIFRCPAEYDVFPRTGLWHGYLYLLCRHNTEKKLYLFDPDGNVKATHRITTESWVFLPEF